MLYLGIWVQYVEKWLFLKQNTNLCLIKAHIHGEKIQSANKQKNQTFLEPHITCKSFTLPLKPILKENQVRLIFNQIFLFWINRYITQLTQNLFTF
jgi:hypothetical protein